jgi:hypothetical protein
LLRPRRGGALRVEALGDLHLSDAVGAQFEDAAHDDRLGLVHAALDVRPPAVRVHDLDVVIAEESTAADVPRAASRRRCAGALFRVRARRQRRETQHDPVGRTIERAFPIFEVEKHAVSAGRRH